MNNQALDQIATQIIDSIYLFSKGKKDENFALVRNLVGQAYLTGSIDAQKEAIEAVKNSQTK